MNRWIVEIQGPIMGAVRTTQRQKFVDPRYQIYEAYKRKVRLLANIAEFPEILKKDSSYGLTVEVFWKRRARADLDNICKGAMDSLFKQDRRILSIRAWANENSKEEKAILTLSCLTSPKSKLE